MLRNTRSIVSTRTAQKKTINKQCSGPNEPVAIIVMFVITKRSFDGRTIAYSRLKQNSTAVSVNVAIETLNLSVRRNSIHLNRF